MTDKEIKKWSKLLSFILRHAPDTIDIKLDNEGWANVDELLKNLPIRGIDREWLDEIIAKNNKKRFAYNEDATKIRACQGHSLDVKLDYKKIEPPEFLYHGTALSNLDSIIIRGICRQTRTHVHLSTDYATALSVGQRHGRAVVLRIKAKDMHADGIDFYISDNGVWLVDHVPPQYIVEHRS